MVKTTDLVMAMRCSCQAPTSSPPCTTCAYRVVESLDGKEYTGCDCDRMGMDAADKIEELVDRCARYAEEIAVLREEQKRAAAADVASVVHGRWEPCFDENCRCRWGFGKCSNCGQEYYAHAINHYNYCPNCGAKMDGGDGRDG